MLKKEIRGFFTSLLGFFLTMAALVTCAPAGAQGRETTLTIYTYPMGSANYVHSYAISQIVNKHSSWLKVQIMAAGNPVEAVLKTAANANRSIGCFSSMELYRVIRGEKPFPKAIPSMRGLGSTGDHPNAPVAKDPNIKRWADLKGKRLAIISPTSFMKVIATACLERAGLKPDDYEFTVMSFKKGLDCLRMGTVDITFLTGAYFPSKKKVAPNPIATETISTVDVHWLPIEREDVEYAQGKFKGGLPTEHIVIPVGAWKGVNVPVQGYTISTGLFADASLDDSIVTEFMRVWLEHFDEISKYLPPFKAAKREDIGLLRIGKGYFHRAALKALEERGISVR